MAVPHTKGSRRRAVGEVAEAAFARLPVGVVVADATGTVLASNDTAARLTASLDVRIETGQALQAVQPDGTPYELEGMPVVRAIMTQQPVRHEDMHVPDANGGVRTLQVTAAPLGDDIGVAVFEDVTEQRDTERQRERLHLHLARLHELASALSRMHTPEQVLDEALGHVVEIVGAAAASAALLGEDGHTLDVAASLGYPPELLERYGSFDLDAPYPLAAAVRNRMALVYNGVEDFADQYPHLAGDVASGGNQSWAAVPLIAEDRILGGLGFSFGEVRSFTQPEIVFLRAVATQCALALDRTRLYRDEAIARAEADLSRSRLSFLANVSQVFASTLDPRHTLANIAEMVVPHLGDFCIVSLLDAHGVLVPQTVSHGDPAMRVRLMRILERWPQTLNAPSGAGAAARTGRGTLYPRITDEMLVEGTHDAEHLAAVRKLGVTSGMAVPLRARGRILGAMTIARTSEPPSTEADLAMAEQVATRAAVAIDNARMYTERLHAARQLQESLLPSALPDIPNMQVGVSYVATGQGVEVGGDFYDVVDIGQGAWLCVVGDVRGKGIEAASVTGMARHTIRAVAGITRSPSETLEHLHRALRHSGEERGDVDPRFATVCMAVVVPHARGATATVCCAGHPLPLLRSSDGKVRPAGKEGTAVGLLDDVSLTEETVALAPGDHLVFMTDGILERRHGNAYFEDRIARVIEDAGPLNASDLAAHIQQQAEAHAPTPLADDMAVLVLGVPRT